jgi:high-affinity iron transporter
MRFTAWYCRIGLVICLATLPGAVHATADRSLETLTQFILHTLDYLAVDYPHTVKDSTVTDPDEYAEQREFAQQLQARIGRLPDSENKSVLQRHAAAIAMAIDARTSGDEVRALCTNLASMLIATYKVQMAPILPPPMQTAAATFHNNCAACHGREGLGDGPVAATLEPRPSNFHARDRQAQRSVYSLYSTITLGVEGTAMPSFASLSASERWALAFYVSNFFATPAERSHGKALWQQGQYHGLFPDLRHLTQTTPAGAASQHGDDGVAVLAYLRTAPEQVAASKLAPLVFTRQKLDESLAAYRAGDSSRAYDLAVTAYLEGFELAEAGLSAVDANLNQTIETNMNQYRQAIKQGVATDDLADLAVTLQQLLQQAGDRLTSTRLSPTMSFGGAYIILLREGLEAILVLAAIMAFLIKIQRRDALRYVHAGWMGALGIGLLTWLVTRYLISFSGASRELTEGVTALFATAMLIYVGFWLHNHTHAQRWQSFLHNKVNKTLTEGTLWSLALISFIAVYREVVETVLFYETFWIQTQPAEHGYLIAGLGGAVLSLVILAWLIFRFSVRLPLRLFFHINTALMLTLAVIFAGKGVVALQEAGKLPVDPINLPTIATLGIYPTLESIGLQLVLVCIIFFWLIITRIQDTTPIIKQAP